MVMKNWNKKINNVNIIMWGCLDREVISQCFLINMDETQVYYFLETVITESL